MPRHARTLLALAATTAGLAFAVPVDGGGAVGDGAVCTTPASVDDAEAPCNPYLADAPWSGAHRNSYAQGSSHLPGVEGPAEQVHVDHVGVTGVPVIASFSPPYPDGRRVVWASTVGPSAEVVKVDVENLELLDKYVPPFEERTAPAQGQLVSGAYNLVDRENRLHVGRSTSLEVYGDLVPGARTSPIALLHRFELPPEALCGEDELVGITMTYDGHIAFLTANAVLGVVPRDPARMNADNLVVHRINGEDCSGGPDGPVEVVSNSLAADEDGGIYPVTGHAQYRIDWDGSTLTEVWRASYGGAGQTGAGRLGPGSGSTPSLMGTGPDDDRFVVITDGQDLMHLVLLWRDEIPADWEPVREGADRRIACEVPVTFGDETLTRSTSEQSVLVRGTSAVVVNNQQPLDEVLSQAPPQASPLTALLTGTEPNVPRGAQKFSWDPATRTCAVDWGNPDVAIPNSIPTMSAASNLLYGIGVRDDVWTLEGLDWDTGEVVVTVPTSASPTSNSTYAAATVGPDGAVWYGTFGGLTRFLPCDPAVEADCGRRLGPTEALVGEPPTDPQGLVRYVTGQP